MGGVCCGCCEPDATQSEKAPLFGTSNADTRYSTTVSRKAAARENVNAMNREALTAVGASTPASTGVGAGSTAIGDAAAAGQRSRQSERRKEKEKPGSASASGGAVSNSSSAGAAPPVFNRRFTAIVTNIPRNELVNVEKLFREVTKRSDLSGRINRAQFEEIFAPFFPDCQPLASRLFDSLATRTGPVRKHATAAGSGASGGDSKSGADGKAAPKEGTVTFRALCTALYMWCEGTMKDKLRLLFEMHDSDRNGVLSRDEIKEMIQTITRSSAATGALLMRDAQRSEQLLKGFGGEEDMQRFTEQLDDDLELFLDSFISRMDSEFEPDGQISLGEWLTFAGQHPDIKSFLREFEVNFNTMS